MTETGKKRLLFIYANQFGYHTDSFKYSEYLRDTYEITYYCFDQNMEKINLNGVRIVYIPFNTGKIRRLIDFYRSVIKHTREEQYDIIFTIQFKFCFLIGLFAKGKSKILDYRTGDLSENNMIRKIKNRVMFFDSLFFKHISVISDGLRGQLCIKKQNTLI